MVNIKDVYEKVINLSGQFQVYNCTPSVLEANYDTFLSAVSQAISIYNDYRPQIVETPIVTGQWNTTFGSKENTDNFVNYNFYQNPPDIVRSVYPTNISGLTPPYLYDSWKFNTEKLPFIWKYNKPTLYLMYPGRFNISCVYYHRIQKHLKNLALTSSMIGSKIEIDTDDMAESIAQKTAYWINRELPTIFTAVAVGSGVLRITNIADGVSVDATEGNTTWVAPTIVQQGGVALPEITEFTCNESNVSIQSKYITISSPTDTYYLWFSIDGTVGDPIEDNYFLYYINDDYDDRIFFDLTVSKFMQLLGRARGNFGLTGLDITNSGATMLSDGLAWEDKIITTLREVNNKFYLAWK